MSWNHWPKKSQNTQNKIFTAHTSVSVRMSQFWVLSMASTSISLPLRNEWVRTSALCQYSPTQHSASGCVGKTPWPTCTNWMMKKTLFYSPEIFPLIFFDGWKQFLQMSESSTFASWENSFYPPFSWTHRRTFLMGYTTWSPFFDKNDFVFISTLLLHLITYQGVHRDLG